MSDPSFQYFTPHRVSPHRGVRTDRYKLIYFHRLNQWELYDLKKDPHELNNLYSNPKYSDTVQKLKSEMDRLRKQLNDHDQYVDGPPTDK